MADNKEDQQELYDEDIMDLEQPGATSGRTDITECDSCGGHMVFDPKAQGMRCPYCGGEKSVDKTKENIVEIDISDMNRYDFNWKIEKKVIQCNNCGGETMVDPTDETQYCAFCGSQHILERPDENMGMKPQGILPFHINEDDGRERLKGWIKRRYLAPRDLKQRYLGRELKGMYMPYWTFDANTHTHFSCQVGTYYYTGSGENRKRHVRWRHHSGYRDMFFDDKLVCGISHQLEKYIKRIEPYDMHRVVDYSPEFIAGYYASKYTVMPQDAFRTAKDEMESEISAANKSSLPGDTYRNYSQRVSYSDVTFKHLLLPLYMMSYAYNQKTYHVMINGQTGEVQGEAPISPVKVGLIVLGVIAVVVTFLLLRNAGVI